MGKIFVIMGPSCSGKDTLFSEVSDYYLGQLKQIVLYTTRPMRTGEIDGITYHFIDDNTLNIMKENNEIIETRLYNTVNGIWTYATSNTSIDLENNYYLIINTLEGFKALKNYYGEDSVIPLYIKVDEDVRITRAETREKKQVKPNYEEMARRIMADSIDFSEEKRIEAGIPDSNVIENNANPADAGTWVPRLSIEFVRDQIVAIIDEHINKELYAPKVYKKKIV